MKEWEESGMPLRFLAGAKALSGALYSESESRWTGEHGNFLFGLPSLNPSE